MSIDDQDPLPESSWFWRRIATYVTTAAVMLILGFIVGKVDEAETLEDIAKALLIYLALLHTFYFIAPSAEHMLKVVQLVRAWRSGVQQKEQKRVVTEPERQTEVATTEVSKPKVVMDPKMPPMFREGI